MPCVELGQAICLFQGGGDLFEVPGAFLLSAQAAGDAVTTFM